MYIYTQGKPVKMLKFNKLGLNHLFKARVVMQRMLY